MDLAADIGQEFNLPLDRIGEKFSFEAATKLGLKDTRLVVGRRAEKMFEYVVASLGKAEFVQQEDVAAPLYAGDDVQAPDYFVALKTGERYFVEVKHTRADTSHAPVSFSRNYLARLKRYASLKGHPLVIAVYWRAFGQWTINKVADFETPQGTINLRLPHALQKSIAGDFGDRMIAVVPPLVCRLHAEPDSPRSLNSDGIVRFTIGEISFHSEGLEILTDLEKQVAFYLVFHSRWNDSAPTAKMDDDRLVHIDFIAEPPERNKGQEFEILGSIAGMISQHFEWLTTADDRIVRLTPQLRPDQMAPAFDESYSGQVLRMWQFRLEPNYKPLNGTGL